MAAGREHHYAAEIVWTGAGATGTSSYAAYGRDYRVGIAGKPSLAGSADPQFRGDASLHNPEDLLVAALSACHMLTYLAEAARAGLTVLSYSDDARGTMRLEGNGGQFTEVLLRPRVTIAAGGDRALAERLHEAAHHQCFLARSMNFPVRHEAVIEIAGD